MADQSPVIAGDALRRLEIESTIACGDYLTGCIDVFGVGEKNGVT
jgi:hypothetical protein